MILLLDNTVLSNFVLVNRVDLLPKALGSNVAATSQVVHEFKNGVSKGVLPETDLSWIQKVELDSNENVLYEELLKRVNAGEASSLAVVAHRNGRFLTDDRDARKLAAQLKIPVSGTLGVLLRLVQIDVLTLSEANGILQQMIDKGYRSPVQNLSTL